MDFWDLFLDRLRNAISSPLFRTVRFAQEMEISRSMAFSSLHDPFRFRARFLGLEVAYSLMDEKGNFCVELAELLYTEIQSKIFLIGPSLENELFLFEHLQSCLETLLNNESVRKLLLRISLPLCHKGVERLIRDTLWPESIKELRDVDVRRAVLAAWFTWLRQTTGSCFATAPAIVIQTEQPQQFLQDLFDLLMMGALRRVTAGQEYAVPLCPSMEQADLLRPIGSLLPDELAFAPGLLAAFDAARLFNDTMPLPERRQRVFGWVEKEEGAKTPKELIEAVILRALGLEKSDVIEEEGLRRLELNPLLVRQSAIYYQRPTERANLVSKWKEKVAAASHAYQAFGDCALLRAWESTIASFSDVKVDIGRWNLYNSLGMHPDQSGGIGDFLYQRINERLQKINREILDLRMEYQRAVSAARSAERMGLNAEWTRSMYTANAISSQVEQLSKKAEALSPLLSKIIGGYDRLIPESFQEIFDPSLAQNVSEMIDDSPAGFRLAYKHGRSASSQWTFIRSGAEFIRSLREFFEHAERELSREIEIEELSTELIQFIQTDLFLQGAIERANANPIMQGRFAKPWEYISGGSLPGLLQSYYNRVSPFTIFERKIQTENELLFFLKESVHRAPPCKRILMHSPTHAFILRPDWFPSDPMQSMEQMKIFWDNLIVQEGEWLAMRFSSWLPQKERPLFLHRWRQKENFTDLLVFRNHMIDCIGAPRAPTVDAFLYESLPVLYAHTVLDLGSQLIGLDQRQLQPYFADAPCFTPVDFRERLKAAWIASALIPFSATDWDATIASALRMRNLAAPMPILFGDTNWSAGFFGLAVSPQKTLALWRFQRTGMRGVPMHSWFHLQKEGNWTVLCRPQEYTRSN